MRRTLSFVIVLALALVASPAVLADDQAVVEASAADLAAAAAPAVAAPAEGDGLCPTVDPLGNPASAPSFVSAGPCYVQRQCDDSSIISCNGASSCSSGPGTGGGYVTCDGVTTWCPYVPPVCSDGQPCTKHSMCGTCDGAPCYCFNHTCVCL